MADEAGDEALRAYVLMRRAQRAVEWGDSKAAATFVQSVLRASGLPPRVRALAAVRLAQAHAQLGDAIATRRSIGAAFHHVDRTATEEPRINAMVNHCTSAYVRAYEACCRLLLGEYAAAVREFETVLPEWPRTQRLDEGYFRAHFAVALQLAGETEAARAHAVAARNIGIQTGSARTLSVVGTVTGDDANSITFGHRTSAQTAARPTGEGTVWPWT